MSEAGNGKATLPYGAFPTLKGFIGRLKQSAIPPRIDNSVMVGMSGSGKSELRTSLKYLGLVDSNDVVQSNLRRLVQAYGEGTWADELSAVIFDRYSEVIGEDAEWLDNGTPQQLRDRFRAVGGDGSTLDRSIRFFLAAATDAGVKLSPFFTMKGARTSNPRTGTPKRRSPKPSPEMEIQEKPSKNQKEDSRLEAGMTRYPFALPGGGLVTVTMPDLTTPEEWGVVNTYITGMLNLKKPKKA